MARSGPSFSLAPSTLHSDTVLFENSAPLGEPVTEHQLPVFYRYTAPPPHEFHSLQQSVGGLELLEVPNVSQIN